MASACAPFATAMNAKGPCLRWLTDRETIAVYIVVLANTLLSMLVFVYQSPGIVERYYTADLRAQYPGDFATHVVLLLIFIAFELLTVCLLLTGLISGAQWACNRAAEACCGSPLAFVGGRLCRVPWGRIFACFLSSGLLFFCVAESQMLVDMGVHVLDIELMAIAGVGMVVERRANLGFDGPVWLLIQISCIALLILEPLLVWGSARVAAKLMPRQVKKLGIVTFGTWAALYLLSIASFRVDLMSEKVTQFQQAVPMNVFDRDSQNELIPVIVRAASASAPVESFPAPDVAGYPALHTNSPPGAHPATLPTFKHKRNVILIAEESYRYDFANADVSPKTIRWFNSRNRCFRSDVHYSNAHVSELSYFALLYGIDPFHYHQFSMEHVASMPVQIFRENGYYTIIIAASLMWAFPNRNVLANFHKVYSMDDNETLLRTLKEFLEERKADGMPFFLYLNPYKAIEQVDLSMPVNRTLWDWSFRSVRDRDRIRVFDMLAEYGVLDEAVMLLTSDHGNMEPEDLRGEMGHGQSESSWWQQKVSVPLWMCFPATPGSVAPQFDKVRSTSTPYDPPMQLKQLVSTVPLPPPTTHSDVMPTIFAALGLQPAVNTHTFTSGRELTLVEDARTKQLVLRPVIQKGVDRDYALFSPRYFPARNKIIGMARPTLKLWFRVTKFDMESDTGRTFLLAPERLSDLGDDVLPCATTAELRSTFQDVMSTPCLGPEFTAKIDARRPDSLTCKEAIQAFCPSLDHFSSDFWRFFAPSAPK